MNISEIILYNFCICININFFYFLLFFLWILNFILHDSFSSQDFSILSLPNPFVPESFLICYYSFSSFNVLSNRDIRNDVFASTVEAFELSLDFYWGVVVDIKRLLSWKYRECFHTLLRHTLVILFQSENNFNSTWFNYKSPINILYNLKAYFVNSCRALAFFFKI